MTRVPAWNGTITLVRLEEGVIPMVLNGGHCLKMDNAFHVAVYTRNQDLCEKSETRDCCMLAVAARQTIFNSVLDHKPINYETCNPIVDNRRKQSCRALLSILEPPYGWLQFSEGDKRVSWRDKNFHWWPEWNDRKLSREENIQNSKAFKNATCEERSRKLPFIFRSREGGTYKYYAIETLKNCASSSPQACRAALSGLVWNGSIWFTKDEIEKWNVIWDNRKCAGPEIEKLIEMVQTEPVPKD